MAVGKFLTVAESVHSTVKTNKQLKPAIKCLTKRTFGKKEKKQSTFARVVDLDCLFSLNSEKHFFICPIHGT